MFARQNKHYSVRERIFLFAGWNTKFDQLWTDDHQNHQILVTEVFVHFLILKQISLQAAIEY